MTSSFNPNVLPSLFDDVAEEVVEEAMEEALREEGEEEESIVDIIRNEPHGPRVISVFKDDIAVWAACGEHRSQYSIRGGIWHNLSHEAKENIVTIVVTKVKELLDGGT